MNLPIAIETLRLTLVDGIASVELSRPDKASAMNLAMWHEIRAASRPSHRLRCAAARK